MKEYVEHGLSGVYLIPPILRGGRRNYQAAADVISAFHGQLGS